MNYRQEHIVNLANRIKQSGFRVFISNNGEYGFFTDKEGTKVVSFQNDLGCTTFSGNYKTDKPATTGTGWRIADSDSGDYESMFNQAPPRWAVSDSKWKHTSLNEHLSIYGTSSGYKEV